jgi:membrane protein YdbS with pleckstrin-like domain
MSGHSERAAAWIYRGIWSVIVRFFRVPSQPPALPTHAGQRHDSFQPGPGYLRYLKFQFWVLLVVIDVALLILWIVATVVLVNERLEWMAALLVVPALALIVVPDIVAYIGIHLRYDTTWYVLTDRSLRIRRGLWIINEITITFENIQNVTVQQGPLQRWFGIATVEVQTAGGGTSTHPSQPAVGHRGSIEGIGNATEVRDLILERVRASMSAGLGDERGDAPGRGGGAHRTDAVHGVASAGPTWTGDHLAALRAIRDELRAASAGGAA